MLKVSVCEHITLSRLHWCTSIAVMAFTVEYVNLIKSFYISIKYKVRFHFVRKGLCNHNKYVADCLSGPEIKFDSFCLTAKT